MFEEEIRLVPPVMKSADPLPVTWCFPGPYSIGMSGLGYQLIWWIIEQQREIVVRRSFSDLREPGADKGKLFGFTLSWELDFIEVVKQLDYYSIARRALDRGDDCPLVFGGGPVLTANPEPFADFFDVILLGDAEETIPALLQAVLRLKGHTRNSLLQHLAEIPGIYVPSFYRVEYEEPNGPLRSVEPTLDHVPRRIVRQAFRAPDHYLAHSVLLAPGAAWGDVFLIEIVRSCPQECRFCLASYLTRPFRSASVETIVEKVIAVKDKTAKFGLVGPSITEHPQFETLCSRLADIGDLRVSIASVRADTMTKELADQLAALGQKSVTIAIESGSQRLRDIMKKNLTTAQIESAVENISAGGLSGIKFYGIAGLPYESFEDIDATIDMLLGLKSRHKKIKFTFGVSSFVPKAQTPFQWKGRDRECKRKIEYLQKKLAPRGIELRKESHNWSDIQGLLARGDRRLTPVLLEVADSAGKLGDWRAALRKQAKFVPSLEYYAYRDIPPDEILPWSHVSSLEKESFLLRHLDDAGRLAVSVS